MKLWRKNINLTQKIKKMLNCETQNLRSEKSTSFELFLFRNIEIVYKISLFCLKKVTNEVQGHFKRYWYFNYKSPLKT